MRTRFTKLGLVAGSLVGLATMASPAQAQFGCAPAGQYPTAALAQQGDDPAAATSLPNDGTPNAFAECQPPCCWTQPLVWANAEYLYGITRREPFNTPLVTTSSNSKAGNGTIGQSTTSVLEGLEGIDLRHPTGMEFTLGISPTRDWCVPLEVSYFYQQQRSDLFNETSSATGSPVLSIPVFSTQTKAETVRTVSFPAEAKGSIDIPSSLQLWGIRAVGVVQTGWQWGDDCCGMSVTLPIGFRYLNMNETLDEVSTATALGSGLFFNGKAVSTGNTIVVTDMFKGLNEFRGGELGVRVECRFDRFDLTFDPRVSVGSTEQAAIIDGISVMETAKGVATAATGGIFAVPSNSGRHTRELFSAIPEGTFTLGWNCCSWLRFQAGYDILYWYNVVQPGNEINRNVDLRQVPTSSTFSSSAAATATNPTFSFKDSTFLMQSVNVGVVLSF